MWPSCCRGSDSGRSRYGRGGGCRHRGRRCWAFVRNEKPLACGGRSGGVYHRLFDNIIFVRSWRNINRSNRGCCPVVLVVADSLSCLKIWRKTLMLAFCCWRWNFLQTVWCWNIPYLINFIPQSILLHIFFIKEELLLYCWGCLFCRSEAIWIKISLQEVLAFIPIILLLQGIVLHLLTSLNFNEAAGSFNWWWVSNTPHRPGRRRLVEVPEIAYKKETTDFI